MASLCRIRDGGGGWRRVAAGSGERGEGRRPVWQESSSAEANQFALAQM